jgi:hypothetical protein
MNDNDTTQQRDPIIDQKIAELFANLEKVEAQFDGETMQIENEIKTSFDATEKEYASLVDIALDFDKEHGDQMLEDTLQELADEDQAEQELQEVASERDEEIPEPESQLPKVVNHAPKENSEQKHGFDFSEMDEGTKIEQKINEKQSLTYQEIDRNAEKMHFPLQTYIDQWNDFTHIFPKIHQDPVLHGKIIYMIKEHQQELKEKFDENKTGWNTFGLYLMRNFVEQGVDLRDRKAELGAVLEQFKRRMIEGVINNEIPVVPQQQSSFIKKVLSLFKS